MPAIVKIRVAEAAGLPVMDTVSQLTDAYVELKLAGKSDRTAVCRKTLNPVWNADFRFEVDDEDLQDEFLEIGVWDHDYIGQDDVIGQVVLDLKPLLISEVSQLKGWFPVYDTLHGVRGSLRLVVKLELFRDQHRYRDTSTDVIFFSATELPDCYHALAIHGFVEELIVNDDPEHQWIDRIRPTRASNQARQALFARLTGELQRLLGVKAQAMGGNAVVGYRQVFDLEGDSGMVARGIGTVMSIEARSISLMPSVAPASGDMRMRSSLLRFTANNDDRAGSPVSSSPTPATPASRASTAPQTSVTPPPLLSAGMVPGNVPNAGSAGAAGNINNALGNSTNEQGGQNNAVTANQLDGLQDTTTAPNANMTTMVGAAGASTLGGVTTIAQQLSVHGHVPLITLCSFSAGFLLRLGGIVTARAIKLLDRMDNPDETVARDAWWNELREEISSHTRALGYTAVVGYAESTSIAGNLCLLTATGTAAIVNTDPVTGLACMPRDRPVPRRRKKSRNVSSDAPLHSNDESVSRATSEQPLTGPSQNAGPAAAPSTPQWPPVLSNQSSGGHREASVPDLFVTDNTLNEDDNEANPLLAGSTALPCEIHHLPQEAMGKDFAGDQRRCQVCHRVNALVPELHLTTIDPPADLLRIGESELIQTQVCRVRRKTHGSADSATELGESLPFLEYALYRQMILKLRARAMNSAFNLRVQILLSQNMIVAVATGTAVHVAALDMPPELEFSGDTADGPLGEVKRAVETMSKERHQAMLDQRNKSPYAGFRADADADDATILVQSAPDSAKPKKTVLVELDDQADGGIIPALLDMKLPEGVWFSSIGTVLGLRKAMRLQPLNVVDTVVAVHEVILTPGRGLTAEVTRCFDHLMLSMCYKYRQYRPCLIGNLRWELSMPEENHLQVTMVASVLALGRRRRRRGTSISDSVSTDPGSEGPSSPTKNSPLPSPQMQRRIMPLNPLSKFSSHSASSKVTVTPLGTVPGQRIVRHLGTLLLYLIKETMAVRQAGGVGVFVKVFIAEILAIARAHVHARGGNALVGFRIKDMDIIDNVHKDQAQCLLAIQGDAVLSLEEDDEYMLSLTRQSNEDLTREEPATSTSSSSMRMVAKSMRESAV